MSDSEENRSGTSSALLNIASAYSDSESSQEISEDNKSGKNLGHLTDNFRVETKKPEGEGISLCETQNPSTAFSTTHPGDTEKTQSLTKIVRLDSGKVVKISTSPGSKAPEFRPEESHLRTGSTVLDTAVESDIRHAGSVVNNQLISNENFVRGGSISMNTATNNSSVLDVSAVESNTDGKVLGTSLEVKQDVKIVNNSSDLETRICNTNNDKDCFGFNTEQNSVTNSLHTTAFSEESRNVDNRVAMGMKSTKEELKPDDKIVLEGDADRIVPNVPQAISHFPRAKMPDTENEVEVDSCLESPNKHSKPWLPGMNSLMANECNDNLRGLKTPVDSVHETIPDKSLHTTKNEDLSKLEYKTESNILNTYLTSKREKKFMTQDMKIDEGVLRSTDDMYRSKDIKVQRSEFGQDNVEKLTTAGTVADANIKVGMSKEAVLMTSESGVNLEDSIKNKLEMCEINKHKSEFKPLPRLERLNIKPIMPGAEGPIKKTDLELQQSSPALYKMLETCDSHQATSDIKKLTCPAPIKLKRNFSSVSSTSSLQPEKKFVPEPSETARITSSDSELSSSLIITPTKSEISGHSDMRSLQQDTLNLSPIIQMAGSTRSPLSPTFQQVSSHQQPYHSSFTNMINTCQNQVPTFQPLKRSPQHGVVQSSQRSTRREEQKRTLPLILRKADLNSKAREISKIEDLSAKVPHKKEDLNSKASSKLAKDREMSLENMSSEFQEQSASVSFSNSSSNQEHSNFGSSVNFENMIGSSSSSKEGGETPMPENSGSDNARQPPTPTKQDEQEERQQTSFITEPVQVAEVPPVVVPKKRGRPRKFPLPETPTGVGTWPAAEKNGKSTPKTSKRKKTTKKSKAEGQAEEEDGSKKRYIPRYKKKRKSLGEEPETPRSFNKKGRMEVVTEGCKPVTVNQITEYFWPPISSLPPGEKPEGLMIQEQISEYLGVKSFKRKYPSIKRRAVDMEERNYLQENGYVSENMCDMGLTAVYSADIMEIMYNDFPHKFDEYRRYTREKKIKEQKALREKQAAENMDPRKEALESIVSWNTEFNKTREMERPKRLYNYNVLMGEWYERKIDEEYKLAMYLKKKERGQLTLMRVRRLFSNLLKDVQLSLPSRGLTLGGVIQLLAQDVPANPPNHKEKLGKGLVLAVTVEADDIDHKHDFEDNLLVVGSPVLRACARNSFYIDPEDKRKEGHPLCFGDVFSFRCAAETEVPLYIAVPVLSPYGTVGKSGYPVPRLSLYKGYDARFTVLHLAENLREETIGKAVSPFEKVLVVHSPVNLPLCTEISYWQNSLFSPECEVSVHACMDLKKEYEVVNQWMFVVGSKQ